MRPTATRPTTDDPRTQADDRLTDAGARASILWKFRNKLIDFVAMLAGGGTARPKVLIVDDDRDIREALGELLADEGFLIESAWNGAEALKRLQAGFRPNVIILDLMMPVMDGFAFRAAQKQSPELAHIPVIGVTAVASIEADFECLRKPVRFDTLVERIHTTIS